MNKFSAGQIFWPCRHCAPSIHLYKAYFILLERAFDHNCPYVIFETRLFVINSYKKLNYDCNKYYINVSNGVTIDKKNLDQNTR